MTHSRKRLIFRDPPTGKLPYLRFGVFRHKWEPIVIVDLTHVTDRRWGYRALGLDSLAEVKAATPVLQHVEWALSEYFSRRFRRAPGRERQRLLEKFAGLSRMPFAHRWFQMAVEELRSGLRRNRKQLSRLMAAYAGVGSRTLRTYRDAVPRNNRIFIQWMTRSRNVRDPENIEKGFRRAKERPTGASPATIHHVITVYGRVFETTFVDTVIRMASTDRGVGLGGAEASERRQNVILRILASLEKAYDIRVRPEVPPVPAVPDASPTSLPDAGVTREPNASSGLKGAPTPLTKSK